MRLLHVVESLDRGGLERVVCDLALAQTRAGHHVEVFCLFEAGAFAPELVQAGLAVHAAGKTRGFDLRTLRHLRRVVREGDHELLHTHNPVANYYACLAELSSWGRLPIVNTRHNMGARNPNDRREKLFRWSVHRTARVAMVSPQVSAKFVASGIVPQAKAAVVMNGIPVERYTVTDAQRRLEARARLGLAADALVVGSVGRLVGVKNHALLLQALAPLRPRWPALVMLLVGGGDLADALRDQAHALGVADMLVLAGERPDVPALLPAFDVFAMPSLSEGHSIALLEAACTGLPAVATRVGGNPEVVQEGRTGLLVPSQDPQALGAALAALLEDPARRAAMGLAAREWAATEVSLDAMMRRYQTVYDEALRR